MLKQNLKRRFSQGNLVSPLSFRAQVGLKHRQGASLKRAGVVARRPLATRVTAPAPVLVLLGQGCDSHLGAGDGLQVSIILFQGHSCLPFCPRRASLAGCVYRAGLSVGRFLDFLARVGRPQSPHLAVVASPPRSSPPLPFVRGGQAVGRAGSRCGF